MRAEAGRPQTSGVAPPDALAAVADRVTSRLEGILDEEARRWSALDADLAAPVGALARLVLSGGKRLRAAFCHWSFVGAGGDPDDPRILDAAAAFELLQVFALIHDDVMDRSPTRRGTPTIHTEFAERHTEAAWRGDPDHFGEGVAILVGDVAHVYADRLMTGAPADAMEVWHELRIEVNIGQYLDLFGTVRGSTDLATARRISRYKSGKYTIERPLHLGAALAGRLDDVRSALDAYGVPLGEAFQLRDDLLGVFGEPSRTGKPIGDDLREGKPTPLLAIATERADDAQRAVLARVGADDLDIDDIARIQQVVVDTGARASSEATIRDLTARAAAALDGAPLRPDAIDALCELADYVGARES
ncbi:polyprenyl synthetase family protein [Actinomarinicola tropica]|uniref:Polyprenyl synthetase family protein n=1 Tax=Actinomarinicola tropica TaxID=2789776 RepID=A0A5Q2RR35_9ACTN|nr:polyprenyl synthetase family protein [Actinomarinicola tropica]QGG96607.1 polyprenyl synthetase family protein [Actinomarinicola tropica]